MRRLALILALTGLAAVVAPALAQTPKPRAKASLIQCQPAADQLGRFAVFQGDMQALRGANRMEIRFDLLQQLPGRRFKRVAGTGLGVWNSARRNLRAYRFTKRVENLLAPANYRAVVSFRWRNARGHVVARVQRQTPVCRQPDPRPNLRPGRVGANRAGAKQARYDVVVRNFGGGAANNFDVVLHVNGQALPARTVAALAGSGGRQVLSLEGARCNPGTNLRVVVDPDNRVGETNEGDNTLVVACPLR